MKRLTVLLCFWFAVLGVRANNVRIIEDAKIGNIENNYAELTFKIAWDNSWRDDYNWDAVYVFMKTKRNTDLEWKHAYFMDEGHVMSAGYACWPARYTTTANFRQGVFIFRQTKGKGDAEVTATIHWNLSGTGFSESDLQSGAVELSLQCIEMVYVPMGPYYLGDGVSKNTFRKKFRQILPEWDLVDYHDPSQKIKATAIYQDGNSYNILGPANRVCEAHGNWNVAAGNIYLSAAGEGYWQVEFAEPKTVRYFGVSGYSSSYRPTTWMLTASKNGVDNWKTISDIYGPGDWPVEPLSYPVYHALPVKQESIDAYRFYRISFTSSSGAAINNVALTEKDLSQVTDDGFTVDGQHMKMSATTGLFADDGNSWSGTFSGTIESNGARNSGSIYPNGFEGFYAMKYEISQEQYVRFLNKLNATQQKARTREDLDQFEEGAYVFGEHRDRPDCRNGIVVGARSNGVVIFACDLNPDGRVSQEDDGQTLACNYLSVNDMLAYADWAGLRPLSEMEYEKMGRRPYPQAPDPRGWAGGVRDLAELPSGEVFAPRTTKGGIDERLIDGNLNAGGKVSGPVRVGSYASGAQVPSEAGASYWGVMDLSGNLAEYYYNAGNAGRVFYDEYRGLSHGDGALAANGDVNISTSYWPRNAKAFALRGGSFMSERTAISEGETALSDRSRALEVASLTGRDSTASFRLGHSYTYLIDRSLTYNSYLTLSNGRTTQSKAAIDSVCVGDTYIIRGSELLDATGNPVDGGGKTSYLWYRQENDSPEWRIIPNENGRDLVLTDIRSDRRNVTANANYRFQDFSVRRMAFAPNGAFHVTNTVKIYRINPQYSFNRLADTIRADNSALGFIASTGLETTMTWRWKAAGADGSDLPLQYSTSNLNWYVPKRSDFNDIAGQTHVVVCEMDFFHKCPRRQELTVHVEKRPVVGVASNDITMGGSDPSKECGVVMQDMRTQSSSRLYKTVKIGNQCWMAENLRYDGAGMAAYSGLKNDDPSGEKYGRLYTYNAMVVNNACPSGWRLPTRAEVQVLVNYLGGDSYAGRKAKAAKYWTYYGGIVQENSSGFSALGVNSGINNAHNGNYFYMVTSDNYYFRMDYSNDAFRYVSSWGSSYLSIRCIKR